MTRSASSSSLFPYTTLFRSEHARHRGHGGQAVQAAARDDVAVFHVQLAFEDLRIGLMANGHEQTVDGQVFRVAALRVLDAGAGRSEEHTSELQSRENLVCRL